MQREDIKSYKDACKCIGRKPRQYKDVHMNAYEQLTTIIAALNFIANDNKPWYYKVGIDSGYYYLYVFISNYLDAEAGKALFCFRSAHWGGHSTVHVGTSLQLKEYDDAEYLKTNFTNLLFDWFRK